MRALSREGIFKESRSGVFGLSRMSRPLLADTKDSVRNLVLIESTPHHQSLWPKLVEVMQHGRPAFDVLYQCEFWEYLSTHAEESAEFDRAMCDLTRSAATPLAESYDFSKIRHLVDIGGGPYLAYSDLMMLLATGGKERTRVEFERLLNRGGFTLERVLKTRTPFSVLVARVALYSGDPATLYHP